MVMIAALTLGIIGFIMAAFLALAYRKFRVEVDPREAELLVLLPGQNCGACGFPGGCSGYAAALAQGLAEPGKCPPGGAEVTKKIAKYLGLEVEIKERKIAKILCQGSKEECIGRLQYDGLKDCRAAMVLTGGDKGCTYGCMLMGSCAKACPFEAITMSKDGLPVVDEEACTGCGICVKVCPQKIIELVPESQKVYVLCSSKDKGSVVRKICKVGCIACMACVKACPFDAVKVEENLAKIDYNKCHDCGLCAIKCPTGSILDKIKVREKAAITPKDNEYCKICRLCINSCPTSAIKKGKVEGEFVVDLDRCIGCEICFRLCPQEMIKIVETVAKLKVRAKEVGAKR